MKVPVDWIEMREDGSAVVNMHEIVRVTAQSNTAADDGLGIAYDYLKELM